MKEVYDFLMNEIEIKKTDPIVVAVSGGPDSMALLHLMTEVRRNIGMPLICAHVNHNLRKESEYEKEFVEEFCLKHDILFEYMKIESYGDDNFHNEARDIRYQYFSSVVKKHNASYLLTAHHGDDLMETILMRMVRGSTLKGYSGFSRIVKRDDYSILRPLIHVTKEYIYEYLEQHKISYVKDSSNEKDVYTRNRFRKYVVPQLKLEDGQVHDKFYKFSKMLIECDDYIDSQVEKYMCELYKQNTLYIENFQKLEPIIQTKIISSILEQIYQENLTLVTNRHVEMIKQLILSERANAQVCLPNNIKVVKAYQSVRFNREEKSNQDYKIVLDNSINLPNGRNIELVEEESSDSNYVCRLLKRDIKLPLYVRNRVAGDKIAVKGLKGHKKIKDIFIDEKIDATYRDGWPVVLDSTDTIVWLPGLKKSEFDKTKEENYDIILRYY